MDKLEMKPEYIDKLEALILGECSDDGTADIAREVFRRARLYTDAAAPAPGAPSADLRAAFMEGAEWFHYRLNGQGYPSQDEAEKFAATLYPASIGTVKEGVESPDKGEVKP